MEATGSTSFCTKIAHGEKVAAVICLVVLFTWLFQPPSLDAAEKKSLPVAESGNCAACHDGDSMVPADHVATTGLTLSECLSCHEDDDPKLTNTMPLSHTHQLSGVTCAQCHGETTSPTDVPTDTCVVCHPVADLVKKVPTDEGTYTHNSHYGPDLACEVCHHVHKASELYCNECHSYDFIVPSPILKPTPK